MHAILNNDEIVFLHIKKNMSHLDDSREEFPIAVGSQLEPRRLKLSRGWVDPANGEQIGQESNGLRRSDREEGNGVKVDVFLGNTDFFRKIHGFNFSILV